MSARYRSHLAISVVAALILTPAFSACSRDNASSQAAGEDGEGRGLAPDGTTALRDFTKVDATGPDNVEVSVGPDFSIRAKGDKAVLDVLRLAVDGDTLEISRKNGANQPRGSATVYVTLPRLTGASLTGSGDMAIDRLTGAEVALSITGSGDISVPSVAVDTLDISAIGPGSYALSGTAKQASISLTGSGDIKGETLKVGRADVSLIGSGNAWLASDGEVSVNLLGSGNVRVKGKVQCRKLGIGSGEVTCG